jgi:F0F1-type ATP synthase membrane subunit b/b'
MKLVEKEIADLKRQVEDVYHDELSAAMEREIDQLIQDAAEEAQRLAEEAAATGDTMRQRLRDMLLTRTTA